MNFEERKELNRHILIDIYNKHSNEYIIYCPKCYGELSPRRIVVKEEDGSWYYDCDCDNGCTEKDSNKYSISDLLYCVILENK